MEEFIEPAERKCGWNEGYSNLPGGIKYSSTLIQTKPQVPSLSRGITLNEDNLVVQESVDEHLEGLKSRKRHRSA